MNDKPLVSILIVTFNAERYIAATLKSCLEQTYAQTEILILDNASQDRTVELIRKFNDPRITLRQSDRNIGPYAGLNELLEIAKGEYVAIQDHDDLWLPEKLERQVDVLHGRPELAGCGTLTFYYYEDRQVLILPPNRLDTDFVDHTSLMFRAGPSRYDVSQPLPDEYFERKTLRALGQLSCLQEGLTVHRIRRDSQNLSSQRTRGNIRGAWSHFQLTGYRDIPGLVMFLVLAHLPEAVRWWLRRRITLRSATWLSPEEFTQHYHFHLT